MRGVKKVNLSRGFVSFDFMFSIIPLLLMISFTLHVSSHITERTSDYVESQIVFDKIVSIGDYLVKVGGIEKEEYGLSVSKRYPNWIDEKRLESLDVDGIRRDMGLEYLRVSLDEPGEGTCIYRIVVTGEEKSIRKLFVCGG